MPAIAVRWHDWIELTSGLSIIAASWVWCAGAVLALMPLTISASPFAADARTLLDLIRFMFTEHELPFWAAVFLVLQVIFFMASLIHVLAFLRAARIPMPRLQRLFVFAALALVAAALLALFTPISPINGQEFVWMIGFLGAASFLFGLSRLLLLNVTLKLARGLQELVPDQDRQLRSVAKLARCAFACGLLSIAITSIGSSSVGSAVDLYRTQETLPWLVGVAIAACVFATIQELCLPITCWKLSRGISAILKTAQVQQQPAA